MAERKTVAQELAVKDGHNWEMLSPEMVSAYLHNADQAIEERSRPPVDEVNPKPAYTCDLCQDKAYIGDRCCLECNPMGLPAEEVYPQIVGKAEARQTEEGKEAIRQNRKLGPNEYRCLKCSKPGKTIIHMLQKGGKGVGHKHKDFKVAKD